MLLLMKTYQISFNNKKIMDDNSLMPWGKYKGTSLVNVPASYLVWIYKNDKCSGEVKEYIKENWDVLIKEMHEG
jgi:uncharacterized protein (DUF3820 family)